ncbi:MAG: GntR family transcriptional regulator [Alphaproteobacteria bacterium]|nr:GntR family transcriptional regulator [Alphaproteobacteria bacterium]MBM3951098.1 GntR family transcriptional regulator [Rhodospirillales bacterium]
MGAKESPVRLADAIESTKPTSLSDKAYRQLEELIVTLRLAPGEVLSEAALAKKLKIGRTPIREALQRLAREGLVLILPRRGVLVSEINVKTQLRLIEVRREIERLMARAAAGRSTTEERDEFRAIAEGMDKAADANDDLEFMRLDRRFNLLMAHAARNEFASKSMGLMHGLSRRFWYLHYKEFADLPLAAKLHAEVARAVASGDAEESARASDRLLDYIEDSTRGTLDARARSER